MTKFLVLIVAFNCSALFASGQQKTFHDMLDTNWHILDQSMSGVGEHRSLPEHTTLILHTDYTWNATELINGTYKGSWREAARKKIILCFPKGAEAELILQEDGKLRMTQTKGLTRTTIYWKR